MLLAGSGCGEQLEGELGLSRVWEGLCRRRKTRSSCLLSCLVLSISVANLLLLEAIKKEKTKTNPLQKILQGVSLCALTKLFLINQWLLRKHRHGSTIICFFAAVKYLCSPSKV